MMKIRLFVSVLCFSLVTLSQAFASEACNQRDVRVCLFDAQIQAYAKSVGVTYKQDSTSSPSVAAEHEWVIGARDIIHLGNTLDFSDDELLFLLAHEYGHSVHRHGRKTLESLAAPEDRSLPDLALLQKYAKHVGDTSKHDSAVAHQQEFESDAFAVAFMQSRHLEAIAAMRGVLKSSSSSATHPSRRARIEKAKQVLATLSL